MSFKAVREEKPSGRSRGSTALPEGKSEVEFAGLRVPVTVDGDKITIHLGEAQGDLSAGMHFRMGIDGEGEFASFRHLVEEEGITEMTIGPKRSEGAFEIQGDTNDLIVGRANERGRRR